MRIARCPLLVRSSLIAKIKKRASCPHFLILCALVPDREDQTATSCPHFSILCALIPDREDQTAGILSALFNSFYARP
jgi:hypothetical protein